MNHSTVIDPVLTFENVRLGYAGKVISDGLDAHIERGRFTVIVGANGCGKSTLLKSVARVNRPLSGRITLEGRDIYTMRGKEVAQRIAFLPQTPIAPNGITVVDLVGRGRYPHQGWFRQWRDEDDGVVEEALRLTDTLALRDQNVDSLSGGQRQRVWIAMVVAQQTDIILLDEPTTYLDLNHQIQLLDLLANFNESQGRTIVAVLHDLNLAARYASHLIGMKGGQVAFAGPPPSVLTSGNVEHVFGLKSEVWPDPIVGSPVIVPHAKRRFETSAS